MYWLWEVPSSNNENIPQPVNKKTVNKKQFNSKTKT